MPNSSGLVNRRNVIATSDATVVSRLKQAGAIPLGVTNCSELCMWYESSNRVYGRTNNPYDLQRIVGGSSGEPQHLGTVLHEWQVKMQRGKSSKSLHTAINVFLGSCGASGLFPGHCCRLLGGLAALPLLGVSFGIASACPVVLWQANPFSPRTPAIPYPSLKPSYCPPPLFRPPPSL